MKKNVLKACAFSMMMLALGACSNEKFHIKGAISEAQDSILYFENMSLDGPVIKDSVKPRHQNSTVSALPIRLST